MSYTYWLIIYKINNEKKLFQIERERVEQLERTTILENSNLNAELNYLKYQINPHFLFNTLSFIYARVIKFSDEAAKSVMLLSNIMNYALLNNDIEGKIELNQELEHLKNLIEINQLRFNKNLHISLELPSSEELAEIKIPQLTLVTFLENVFKYGDLSYKDHPVKISVTVTNNFLRFYISNKKSTSIRQKIQNGIGIANVKKRLDLLYSKEDYNLIIDDEPLTFSVTFYLRIQPC
ncbi:sensor histidine kinase [Pedobacter psychrotolerans]|nr:histidine kinase [Pedobacter psychrotolerans]GGE70531.1 hypothetical protein GCM10011413_41540 [Pedobacter psychrotolerans]